MLTYLNNFKGLKCTTDSCNQELLCGQKVHTLEMIAAEAAKDKKYVEMGRDAIKTTVQAKFDTPLFFIASSYDPRSIPPPSTRVTATMAVAMTWLSQAPQDKIISECFKILTRRRGIERKLMFLA